MTQRKPTVRELADAVLAQAQARPDHTYVKDAPLGACQYVKRDVRGRRVDGCGCIVGEAFYALGVRIPKRVEGSSVVSVAHEFLKYDCEDADDRFLMYGISMAQSSQDGGATWGRAVQPLRSRVEQLDARTEDER